MTKLCRLDELEENQCREFHAGDEEESFFLVRRHDKIYAYRNRCPHTGVSLNWQPDQFLDFEDHHIQCCVHGALFRVEDGLCLRGPCAGQSLTPVAIDVREGEIFLRD